METPTILRKDARRGNSQRESLADVICRQSAREMEIVVQMLKGQAQTALQQMCDYIASVEENEKCKRQPS